MVQKKPWQLGLYEKSMPGTLMLPQKLEQAKRAGYDYMELSIDETDEKLARLDWGATEITALRQAMQSTGLPICSICLSGHRRYPLGDPDEALRTEGLVIMQKAIGFAAALGVRIIQIAGYDTFYKKGSSATREWFRENLAHSVEMAARAGVTLAFETMETPFLNTVEKAMHWVNSQQSPWLQVYPDIGNITNAARAAGTDVLADLRRGRGHISALHLKETRPGVFREVPYGTGHVDFAAAVKEAYALGVRMYVAEFWYTGDERWRENLVSNRHFLEKHLKAAPAG